MDIVSFGAAHRDEGIQVQLRQLMYGHLEEAFAMTWLPWSSCHLEDRGDGALIILPPEVRAHMLLDPLAHHLNAALRRSNRLLSHAAQIRLRVAVHSGFVYWDPYGVVGHAVNHLFRLLDCATIREAIRGSEVDLGLIVSDRLYGDVLGQGGLIDQARYSRVQVTCKETTTTAWLWLPEHFGMPDRRGRLGERPAPALSPGQGQRVSRMSNWLGRRSL